MVEQLICNQQVKGSSPFVSSLPKRKRNQQTPRAATRGVCCQRMFRGARGAVGCPSGQREQTVNLPRLALRRFESFPRSEERRVGKGCRSRWAGDKAVK